MNLLKSLERAIHSRSGSKKKRAKRKTKRKTKRRASKPKTKIVFRTRTIVKRVRSKPRRSASHGGAVMSAYALKRRRAKIAKNRRAKKSGKRKLKFGSPAWRKKYMKR